MAPAAALLAVATWRTRPKHDRARASVWSFLPILAQAIFFLGAVVQGVGVLILDWRARPIVFMVAITSNIPALVVTADTLACGHRRHLLLAAQILWWFVSWAVLLAIPI